MGPEALSILMFVVLMVAIALGHPLAVTLAAVATLFGLIDNGGNVAALIDLFTNNNWGNFLNYTLVSLPLFIFMAQVLDRAKVSEELFEALYIILGGLKGGLGIAIIVVSTVFAATTGIVGASVVAMTLMASPTMLKKGYAKGLSAGIITSSGTLGILIPPSIMLVVYAGLTGQKETSVGNLFAAAILPGLLLSALYITYVAIRCHFRPQDGPPIPLEERTATFGQKCFMFVKSLVPPFGLILAVMGTILAGVATPTEAAALGAGGALLLALFKRTFTWEMIKGSSIATARTTAMVMALFIGGKVFSVVFLSMGGGDAVADFMLGNNLSPVMVLLLMNVVVFILGAFIDWAAILLITVPIFTPIAMELGFDPLWFAMILCVNLQTSFLTPPFGYSLFYFKGAAPPEYTIGEVYRGIVPFIGLQVLGVTICVVWPEIITYLPSVFFGNK
jgi:tripartite ATP-independent transporter DctM subunit